MSPVGWMHWLFCSRPCLDLEDDLGVVFVERRDFVVITEAEDLGEPIGQRQAKLPVGMGLHLRWAAASSLMLGSRNTFKNAPYSSVFR